MRCARRAIPAIALAGLLAAAGAASQAPTAHAATGPRDAAPAQYYGYTWGGWPGWWGGYYGPDFSNPYAGSPGYPYYRYGPYYGNAAGLPYPVAPAYGAFYDDSFGAAPYPYYSTAGGVVFGGDYGAGFFAPLGRCLYSAMAGIGGSWTDPQSYGYYAPFC